MTSDRKPRVPHVIMTDNVGINIQGHGISLPAVMDGVVARNSFTNVSGDMIHVRDPAHLPIPEDLLAELRALAARGVEPKDVEGPIADRLAKFGVDILDWAGRYDTLAKIIVALAN